ncbi:MAG: phosphatase PAP2 family protein [Oscillospiraceae bacterium]
MTELAILDWMQTTIRCGFLDTLLPALTRLGDAGLVWIALTAVLLCTKKYRRAGLAMGCALVLDLLCCNLLLKPLVARIRPCDLNRSIQLLVPRPLDYSFPSGHTAASFAATGALFASGTRLWVPAATLSLLIAFSRLYLYVHFPTDVLAGMVLGTVLGFVGQRLSQALLRRCAARK